jgi:group I intron endonuclease
LQDFVFIVFEYCDSKVLISREQFYIDELKPEYNILKVAGSSLGYRHTDESLAKMSEAQKSIDRTGENHPMFGKTFSHSAETLLKMSEAQKSIDRSGENNPMFGKTGENHPMFGKTGENHPMFGKCHSAESKQKMSEALFGNKNASKMVYVYSFNSETKEAILFKCFNSCSDAALYFDCTTRSISNYLDKNKLYKKQWKLYSSQQ